MECDCPLVLDMEMFEAGGYRALQHQVLIVKTVIISQTHLDIYLELTKNWGKKNQPHVSTYVL